MNEINIRKFLFRMSNGHFFRIKLQNNNILISKNTNGIRWSQPFVIENMHPCFCADLDNRDNLHILCQDLTGDLYYFKVENNKLFKYKILQSKDNTAYDRNFFILQRLEYPIFFYSIRKDDAALLVYQTFSRNGINTPRPISLVPVIKNPFWISYLNNRTALILYPKVSGLYIQICASRLRLDTMQISTGITITNEEANCESPKCIVLEDESIHMLYTVRKNGRSYLKYQKSKATAFEYNVSETIASSGTPFRRYNLECSNEKININWIENGYIYYREKHLTEPGFTKTKILKSLRSSTIEYYSYNSNTQNEKSHIFSTEQPVSMEGRIQHAFYREYTPDFKKNSESEFINEDNNNSSMPQNENFVKAITSFLSSQAGNDVSRQNGAQKIGDFLSLLSKVLDKTEEKTEDAPIKKNFKLRKTDGQHTFKAARV